MLLETAEELGETEEDATDEEAGNDELVDVGETTDEVDGVIDTTVEFI